MKESINYLINKIEWWAQGGLNSRPSRCKRDVITTRPWALIV